MNWKNVLYLLRVERKSSRLLRGIKATHYREHRILAYWPYWLAGIIGIVGGLLSNLIIQSLYSVPSTDIPGGLPLLAEAANSFFVSLPTIILIMALIFTMFQQIQLAGLKKTSQVMYWLPVTWQEHTLASILSNLLGLPIALVIGFAAGIIVFAIFNGLIATALITVIAMLAAAFMGSATTEILRILQVRFTGAVYKSSGRAAIWVRLIGSLFFFIILYLVYFAIFTGTGALTFVQTLATFQNSLWFIPFLWLGITLYFIFSSNLLAIAFVGSSALFIVALYYIAILLNQRFGLYEPPAIRIQTNGIYVPKAGLLGKLGFSSLEAAIIRKDIRAFTRRRELLGIFIIPIVFVIVPIFNSLNTANSGSPPALNFFWEVMIFLIPGAIMSMQLGNMLIGEEGQSVWRIYASPVSPKNLVKSKYSFLVFFSIIIQILTTTVGIIYFQPSILMIIVAFVEGLFLIFALGSIGLTNGFKGADFSVTRRARMIRQEWAIISLLACALAGFAVLAPFMPYAISLFLSSYVPIGSLGPLTIVIALIMSCVIASVFAMMFYRINIGLAKELIRKAEI